MNKTLTTLFALAVALGTASVVQAEELKGDVKAGEGKVAMCVGCHGIVGYKSSFPEVYKVPKIAGQSAGYISASLHAYAKGERRFPTMHAVAQPLSDQEIADISAYYAQLGSQGDAVLAEKPSREPGAQVAALLEKGACVSCHGSNFAKPIDPSYPQLAGQNADYLFVALKAYKTEGNVHIGRSNAIMGGIAKQFSNAELKALAGYIGSLDGNIKTVAESRFR
ncbi:MAG: c-type cytochrome [Giesbergeria sp.]